jgi:hypothetical protein
VLAILIHGGGEVVDVGLELGGSQGAVVDDGAVAGVGAGNAVVGDLWKRCQVSNG